MLYAFGPFSNRRFRLAPGMNLIVGDNEAGKSTIHAALYAALCGVRRARGPARKEDQEFASRHRPWNEVKSWDVGAIVTLDDGRRVELHQNLDGAGESRAVDQSGNDVLREILNEGNPDASRWLGLNRRSFLATACVRQTEVLEVLNDAELLQVHLQRAAAGAGKNETAARALERIDEFQRDHVGNDAKNSTKPLRRAKQRLESARQTSAKLTQERHTLASMRGSVEDADTKANDLQLTIATLEAQVATSQAEEVGRRLRRARELQMRFPDGRPAPSGHDDERARRVVSAVQGWSARPSAPDLVGPSSTELESQLKALPEVPIGDIAPDPLVIAAKGLLERAKLAVELHSANRPAELTWAGPLDSSEEEVRALAEVLEGPEPPADELLDREDDARGSRSRVTRRVAPVRAVVVGVAIASVGIVVAIRGLTWIGLGLALVGAVLAAWAALNRSYVGGSSRSAGAAPRVAGPSTRAVVDERLRARNRALELGSTDRPTDLRRLADSLALKARNEGELVRWANRAAELEIAVNDATLGLEARLSERGVRIDGGADARAVAYFAACQDRASAAALAATRPGLIERLAYRRQAERAAAQATEADVHAASLMREAAAVCGVTDTEPERLHARLAAWLDERGSEMARRETANREWIELQTLLEGRTIEDVTRTHEQQEALVKRLSVTIGAVTTGQPPDNPGALISTLRTTQAEASRKATALRAELDTIERALPSSADVDSELAGAEAELKHVEHVARVLGLARDFLERAQDRVHVTVAPALQGTLDQWLPRVTNGRYVASMVSPESLTVRIKSADGHFRDAGLLSHGTAEQAYLLLRLALTDHLTRGPESCPLILDDVVVQSDRHRTKALLELLLELSQTRQVILSTVSDEAARWGAERLREPRDHVERLDATTVPP